MFAGKKIVFLLGNFELGGAERQALLLACHLRDQEGAEVEVWGIGGPGRASDLCDASGVSWRQIHLQLGASLTANILDLISFVGELRRVKPDVLLPYTWFPNVLCGLTWRIAGCQVCIWNQRDSGIFLDPTRAVHRLAVNLTPFFISNSTHAAAFLKDRFGVDKERLTVIPNGVRLDPPCDNRHTWRLRLGVADSDFVGCMVANFTKLKDHGTAVRAWRVVVDQLLATRSRRAVLVLAGRDDGTAVSITSLIRELDLEGDVCLLDAVDDVTGLLASCDIGVHCSEHEGCPNAVLEEMAAGLPVVASDNDGVRMVLGDGAEPFLAPHRDAEGIAQRILRVALDSDYRESVGKSNQQRISNGFSIETMCRETAHFIDHALRHTG